MDAQQNDVKQQTDRHEETNALNIPNQKLYGSVMPSVNQGVDEYNSGESSSEEIIACTNNLANRKKKRLQKHHKSENPKFVTRISNIVRSARQSEDESDMSDIVDMSAAHLLKPELDPK